MARRVGDVYGDTPRMEFSQKIRIPNPKDIWVNYDGEVDSLIVYTTGGPARGIHVYLDNDISLIVSPTDKQVIGFYIEAFERRFVPAHEEVQESWPTIRETLQPEAGWSRMLLFLAAWLLLMIEQLRPNQNLSSQAA